MPDPQNPPTNEPTNEPTKDPQSPQTIEVKVDGQIKQVSVDDLKEGYTKAAGADELMRKAAEIRKQGEAGIELQELKVAMESGEATEENVRRWGQYFNLTPEETQVQIDEIVYRKPPPVNEPSDKKDSQQEPSRKIGMADLDDNLRQTITTSHTTAQTTQKDKFLEEVKISLDKNEQLVNVTKDLTPETGSQIRNLLVGEAENEARRRMNTGQQYGPALVLDAVNAAVNKALEFSKLVAPAPDGNGQGPPGTLNLGVGGSGVTSIKSQVEEPIKKVAVGEPGYDKYWVNRFKVNLDAENRKNP